MVSENDEQVWRWLEDLDERIEQVEETINKLLDRIRALEGKHGEQGDGNGSSAGAALHESMPLAEEDSESVQLRTESADG